MKVFMKKTKWLVLVGVAIFTTSLWVRPANAYQSGHGREVKNCLISDWRDSDGRKSITLRLALNLAGKTNRDYQRCQDSITIETPIIHLTKPLVIDVKNIVNKGLGQERANGDPEYVIEGKNGNIVTLNADGVAVPSGATMDTHCVVTVRGTNNITLRNVRISKVPVGMSAICFESGVYGVVLDNVHVDGVDDGHGIVFQQGSFNNQISAGASFKNILGGSAIKVMGSELQNFNQLFATNREVASTGQNGLAIFSAPPAGVEEKNISLFTVLSGQFISSVNPIQIRIDRIQEQGTLFRVIGTVVEAGPDADICSAAPKTGAAGVTQLQIYSIQPKSASSDNTTAAVGAAEGAVEASPQAFEEGKFISYVMKRNTTGAEASGGNGIDTQGTTQGKFSFVVDPGSMGNMLVLVPELSNHSIGGASRIVQIQKSERGDCTGNANSAPGGNIGDVFGGNGFSNGMYLTSVKACRIERGIDQFGRPTRSLDPEFDSDRDGIADVLEDLNGNCICDKGDISCWDNPDSDSDGIPDSLELAIGQINTDRVDQATNQYIEDAPFCNGNTEVCDADRDGDSNARDVNSDGDPYEDYVEDRKRAFVTTRRAHYYVYQPGQMSSPEEYHDRSGSPVECGDDLAGAGMIDRGISFGIYRVKINFSERDRPQKQEISIDLQTSQSELETGGEVLVALACRNISVRETSNFNGSKDGNAETSAYSPDGACRGGRLVSGECVLSCEPRETLNAMIVSPEEEAIYFNIVNGERVSLKKEGEIEKLFTLDPQTIVSMCSDMDDDDIPDCVELPSGSCEDLTINRGKNLSPYTKNTDGDGKPDGSTQLGVASDPCPTDPTDACDPISEPPYKGRKILSFFIDRDGDGLKDGEEDRNQDTRKDTIAGLAGAQTTETDPLSKDTDNDGVEDYIEVIAWGRYTNAADPDTDADQLPDSLEVKDYAQTPRDKNYNVGSGAGCGTFVPMAPGIGDLIQYATTSANRFGTDPAKQDSDGDEVNDNVEVEGLGLFVQGEIPEADLIAGLLQGFNLASNPLSADSDGDGLKDGEEYGADGIMTNGESNPCDQDTDNDGNIGGDNGEEVGCRANSDERCVAGSGGNFFDRDGDGLSDFIEAGLGTDPNLRDHDGDGLNDGDEDINHDGVIQINMGETNPLIPDTEGDGLNDGGERKFNADPNVADTDRDGIRDGIEIKESTQLDTDPSNPDTDGDGLCDGGKTVSNGGAAGDVSCIRGEDLDNNGEIKKDPKNENIVLETDPRNPDSDSDGENDKNEICNGGSCNIAANVGRATQGRSEGCFSVSNQHSGSPTSLFYLLGLLLAGNRWMARRTYKKVG